MLSSIIALLLSLGIISAPSDYLDASPEQQKTYESIIIDDILIG